MTLGGLDEAVVLLGIEAHDPRVALVGLVGLDVVPPLREYSSSWRPAASKASVSTQMLWLSVSWTRCSRFTTMSRPGTPMLMLMPSVLLCGCLWGASITTRALMMPS